MKNIFFTFVFSSVATIFWSQDYTPKRAKEINSAEQPTTAPLESPEVIENLVTKTYLVKNEEYYRSFIQSLEEKRKIVLENKAWKEKAEAEGWFTKIDKELEKAKLELQKLQQHEK